VVTYLMRHGRTAYSASYRVNGDPSIAVPLDPEGVRQCCAARMLVPAGGIATCLTSNFRRTAQSAKLVLGEHAVSLRVVDGLDEIDYGMFEGRPFLDYASWLSHHGPWERPPGAGEAQREAVIRMLDALRSVLDSPAPRLVVTHGLLVSVLLWARSGIVDDGGELLFFPEAPCAVPMEISDVELTSLVDGVAGYLSCDNRTQPSGEPGYPIRQPAVRPGSLPSAIRLPRAKALPEEGTSDA